MNVPRTCRSVRLAKARQFEFAEETVPTPQPGEALLRIRRVGVCGSDIHLYQDGRIGDLALPGPFVVGHECMGEVVAVGDSCDEHLLGKQVAVEPAIHCGKCVFCQRGQRNICPQVRFLGTPPTMGAMMEYLSHPVELLEVIPDHLSPEAAVALEPLSIALYAINLSPPQLGQSVAVVGTGVIGTCVMMLLGLIKGIQVVAVDLKDDRLARARELGATHTFNTTGIARDDWAEEVRALCGPYGADVVYECVGEDDTIWNSGEIAAPGGVVSVTGISGRDRMEFRHSSIRRKGLDIQLVRRSLLTMKPCAEMCIRGQIDPELLVTHNFTASQATEAFETVENYRDNVLKAIINMEKW